MESTRDTVIALNAKVVLCRGQTKKIISVSPKPMYLGSGMPKMNLKSAVGQPFGNFKLVLDAASNVFNLELLDGSEALPHEAQMELSAITRDNREILDTSTSQKLRTEDIEEKKRGGLLGSDMIDLLVENSSTFAAKSEYSQQKYIRKKIRKYADRITLLKPSVRLVSEIFFESDPIGIMNLRLDTLSLMLTWCGVSCGGKYIVIESNSYGLVSGGVLERMGGEGTLVKVQFRKDFRKSELEAIDNLDLTPAEKKPLACVPLSDLACLEDGWQDPPDRDDNSFRKTARAALKEGGFDAFIIAMKDNPIELIRLCLPLLSLSKPFAVFSPYREVLAECHVALKRSGGFVQLKLTENWLREYQVLPGRTHPLVTMSGNGGFLLTGVKVEGCGERSLSAPKRARSDVGLPDAVLPGQSVVTDAVSGVDEVPEIMDVAQ